MCRWLAYRGTPVYLDSLIFEPEYSLVSQSLSARQAKVPTNGDGFGVGWYAHRPNPGLFRDVLPAWNDANLKSLSQQIRSSLFFAHVRASTGTETSRSNCHPFSHDRWLFMHNGQIGGWERLRRTLEQSIPDQLYRCRKGTTDSEALFYLLLAEGLDTDPAGALARVVGQVLRLVAHSGEREPFRFTVALSNGQCIYALRYASDEHPPSLYYRQDGDQLLVVSEPLDSHATDWHTIDPSHLLCADAGGVRVQPFQVA